MAKSFSTTGTTIVDTSADIPTASAAYEGVMVFQKDTNELKICDGSAWRSVIDTDTPSGLVYITTVSFSGSNSASFNNVFSASYSRYRVLVDPISLSANNTNNYMYMRMRASGTDAITLYTYNNYGASASGGSTTTTYGFGEYQASAFVLGYNYYGGMFASLDFYNPAVASPTQITGTGLANNAAIPYSITFSGRHETSSAYDGFTIWAALGSVNISGSVRVYGYRDTN